MRLPVKLKRLFPSELQIALEMFAQWILKKSIEQSREDISQVIRIQRQILENFVRLSSAYERLDKKILEITVGWKLVRETLGKHGISIQTSDKEPYTLNMPEHILSDAKLQKLYQLAIDVIPSVLVEQWDIKIFKCQPEDIRVGDIHVSFDLIVQSFSVEEFPVTFFCELKSNVTENIVRNHLQKVRVAMERFSGEILVIFFTHNATAAAQRLIQQSGSFIIFTNGFFQQFPGNN